MERYYKRTSESQEVNEVETTPTPTHEQPGPSFKNGFLEVDLENLPANPGERKQLSCYHPNDRDEIRRAYLAKGPCQPKEHNFPQRPFGTFLRKFNPDWFLEFGSWLEYSVSKDVVFCLCCYLMRFEIGENKGWDAFFTERFSNWKKKDRLNVHVGGPNSAHNQAWRKCNALMNQKQHIEVVVNKQSDLVKREYRIHLTGTIECIRLLLKLGLAFRGDDESEDSKNKGNFLYILQFLAKNDKEFGEVLKRCRGNLKLVAPSIQKDIVKAASFGTTKAIIVDLKDYLFSILIDESRDISNKEQMAVVLRYVDKKGHVIKRFLGVVHVENTTSISLKVELESMFANYNLSWSRVRGQGYDGASNMRGEFNGLKSLILKENKFAFYVHCFAHQLQLALVAVARKLDDIAWFFMAVNNVSNMVGGSCKRRDMLRKSQIRKVADELGCGEISSGRGLNQESTVTRVGDTRWGSHYGTLLRLASLFPSMCDVLNMILEDSSNSDHRVETRLLLNNLQSFEFIFKLLLMRNILGITNYLSQALQRKDQDIVNAMSLVKVSKDRLQKMREDGWHNLLCEVSLFCEKQNIDIVNMDDAFVLQGKPRR
ncbi:zinc finger MYM-type protein 1-like [Medicago truncatula]|uniref:zinc finger MYM-type protein 1-like n=1 Tax=Medicago truncatula TaxID=3880 RepID=UPI000D2F3894|nr:zinc finger MYM-type protein 1-like [Medicago truncatula]